MNLNLQHELDFTYTLATPVLEHGTPARMATIRTKPPAARSGGFFLTTSREDGAREPRVRIRSAISALGFVGPGTQPVSADVGIDAHAGSMTDLPLAIAALAEAGAFDAEVIRELFTNVAFVGELSLAGHVRPVRGLVPMLEELIRAGRQSIVVVPHTQLAEVRHLAGRAVIPSRGIGLRILGAVTLSDVVAYCRDGSNLMDALTARRLSRPDDVPSLSDVRGQDAAVTQLREAIARGEQRILFVGPPGSGKTMLARRVVGLLPELTVDERDEVASIASAAGMGCEHGFTSGHPFRAPHHTASTAGLVGGGRPARPGEVTLATNGVLFLDEIDRFRRDSIEALKSALKHGETAYSHERQTFTMPARPKVVIAAMNPCPCGFHGDREALGDHGRSCTCSPERIERWNTRTAGIREIFPTVIRLDRVSVRSLRAPTPSE
jgi:magnesium chelatase family protein